MKSMLTAAITAVITMSIGQASLADNATTTSAATSNMDAMANIDDMEKCYGIAKAGQNDCSTSQHTCAGASKVDGDKSAWILVPKGLCNKIAGGSLTAKDKT